MYLVVRYFVQIAGCLVLKFVVVVVVGVSVGFVSMADTNRSSVNRTFSPNKCQLFQ